MDQSGILLTNPIQATQAQQEFAKNYPTQARELEQMAKQMQAMQGMQMQ